MKSEPVWTRLTRRAFVAMLGGAATTLAIRARSFTPVEPDPDLEQAPAREAPKKRWIGHF